MTSTIIHEPHPCFAVAARKTYGRLHLPVAPRSNARTRFSDNEKSKPAITPDEALRWLDHVVAQGKPISMVGITGPGDPLAVPGPSLRTLRLARQKHPDIGLCMTTLGLNAADYADEMAEIGLSHVTLLVDAVSPEVAEKLYAWIRPSTKTVPLSEAAKLLVDEQARAVTAFKRAGLVVKINTTVYPGINAGHVEEIAAAMATLSADIMSVTAYIPAEGEPVSPELISDLRDRAARHIDLMPAWKECGEGLVGLDRPDKPDASVTILPKPTKERPQRGRSQFHGHGCGPAPGTRHPGFGLRSP